MRKKDGKGVMVRRADEEGSGRQEDRETRGNALFFLSIERHIEAEVSPQSAAGVQTRPVQATSKPFPRLNHHLLLEDLHVATLSQTDELNTRARLRFTGRSSHARLRCCCVGLFPAVFSKQYIVLLVSDRNSITKGHDKTHL